MYLYQSFEHSVDMQYYIFVFEEIIILKVTYNTITIEKNWFKVFVSIGIYNEKLNTI